ncbi:hypothetical protein BX616_006448 [Lobosporangium transversale]|nr:hypothetical protein BX616_006448 [Lobosporangium transversale]
MLGLIAYVSKTTPLPDALSLCRPSLGNDTAGKEYNAQNVHSSLASHSTRHLQPRNRNRRSILDAAGSSPYSRALHSSLSLQTLPTEIALKKKGNKIERLCKRDDEKEGPEEAQEKVHKNNVCRHSIPNQLMLVNKRFADLVVPMLWRRIVFHGHQTCRSRSLFSALHQVDEKAGLALKKPFESNAFSRDGSCLKHPKRHVFKASLNIMTKRFNAYTSATIKGISAAEQSSGFNHESSCSRRHAIEDRLTSVTHYQKHAGEARWSYGQFVRHVVLNFAHPQASPEMLIKALECLGSRCQNQIQALDLHANEKMQVFGLETPTDMSRLLGTGFSKLRFLRMQGGLVDNQLFCALINGLVEPTATSCRLSQVFLGPGSITDSAIDKLIIAAAQCLEVFHVTSCVDVGGKAIASLLTSCPKLRVLSVHRSLARDKDLLEGLGIEIEANNSLSVVPTPYNLSRVATNEIVAPLERFELGTTKLTTSGITEIIKGTCCSLRFLVLETQHFQDDFLRGVIAPLCKKLEGLYFDESDRSYQQRNPSALRHGQNQEQRTRRRLFDFGRWRGAMANQLEQISLQPQSNLGPHNVSQRNHEMLEERTTPKQSPWLALTSTDAWVLHGRCALWATNSIRSSATVHGMGAAYGGDNLRTSISENFLPEQSRIRPFTVYFRAIRRRFISLLSTTSATTSIDNDNNIQGSVSTMSPLSSIPSVSLGSDMSTESGYQRVLRRFGVHTTTIEVILRSLQHSLKEFSVIEVDLIAASAESSSDGSKMSAENSFVAPDWTPYLG